MIQNESLEQYVGDHNKLIVDARVEVEAVPHDRDWLFCVGIVHIMDKLIEHPECTSIVCLIKHAMFIAREESGRNSLKASVESGSYDPDASES